jgi:hypothetical protein
MEPAPVLLSSSVATLSSRFRFHGIFLKLTFSNTVYLVKQFLVVFAIVAQSNRMFMRSIIFFFLISAFINKVSFCQTNICDTVYKQKSGFESDLCMHLHLSGFAANIMATTSNMEDGSFYVRASNKNIAFPLAATIINLKAGKNESWALYYALIYDDSKHLMTDSAYVGYSKWKYGEESEQYLTKIKKRRIYPENNIFTESITFGNGITFIIERRIFIRKVTFSDGHFLDIPNYDYKD